jgi:uncharacterized membrane protein YdjX (TVP38/TMEM64 family)
LAALVAVVASIMTERARRHGAAVWLRRAGIAALVVGLGYLVVSIWDHEALVRWMNEASPVPFFLAMAVLPAIGVPLSPFMIVAGATFGIWAGLLGSMTAIAINLVIGYAIAHSKLRPRILALFERFDYKVPDFTAGGRKAWRFAAAVKVTPALPAFAKTYILAVTAVPFPIYFVVSFAINSAFAFAWIVLGDSLLVHDWDLTTVAAVAIVVLAVLALMWWRKRRGVSAGDATVAV